MRRAMAIGLGLMTGILAGAALVEACGPLPRVARFWQEHEPGVERSRFLAGQIGVLEGHWSDRDRYVAWRHLEGLGLDLQAWQALEALPSPGLEWPPWHASRSWLTARSKVPGTVPIPNLATERRVRRTRGEAEWWETEANCLADAFRTATRSLQERIEAWGVDAEETREWIRGQDLVFAACDGEGELPPEAPLHADSWLRQDRAYQRAATLFYLARYDEARQAFAVIASDRESPWSDLSAYLMARVDLRRGRRGTDARVSALAQGRSALAEVLEDPDRESLHDAARRFDSLLQASLDPEGRGEQLASLFSRQQLPEDPQQLVDFLRLGGGEVGHWLEMTDRRWAETTWRRPDEVRARQQETLEAWRASGSETWLLAALYQASTGSPGINDLLAASLQVEPRSVAWASVRYHRARLLLEMDRPDEARKELDELLAGEDWSAADRNRLHALRLDLATSLADYMRDAVRLPVAVGYELSEDQPLQDWGDGTSRTGEDLLLLESARRRINTHFSPDLMLAAVSDESLPPTVRWFVGRVLWVRSVISGNDEAAEAVARILAGIDPDLGPAMRAWREVSDADDRRYRSVLLLLRNPGLTPWLGSFTGRSTTAGELDPLRMNWWCGFWDQEASWPLPTFLDRETLEKGRAWRTAIETAGEAPSLLAPVVFRRIESDPDDPTLAEALHLLVKTTRVGCSGQGEVSKRAFEILHRRWPQSAWAERTPYWFD